MRLRILATTDLHANLLAWDYHSNVVCDQRGLARVASLINRARAEVPQCLLFDNGDFLNGSALGDFIAAPRQGLRAKRSKLVHPMIAAMNQLGYDAVTLGNHEFGHGLGFLRRSLSAASFPVVCSNLYFRPTRGKPLSLPFLLVEKRLRDQRGASHTLRIGVMGFLPPQTATWERRYLKSRASVDDIVASAKALLPDLRRMGADLVIALSHSGLGEPLSGPGAENASSALAALDGIDVVIAGHTHLVFPQEGQQRQFGKPVVLPGFHGSHLGVIDLSLNQTGAGWRMGAYECTVRPIAERDPACGRVVALTTDDPAIVRLAMPAHTAILACGEAEIGQTPVPLHSFFSLLADTPALQLVAQAQRDHIARQLASGPYAALPLLSAVAPFKAGGRGGPENYTDIAAGPLRVRHLSDLYLHPNSVAALQVTGAEVLAWLERSVSLYHRIPSAVDDAPLLDAAFPSFNFDMIFGVTYQVDLTQPARFDAFGREIAPGARRIVDLRFRGQMITPDQLFVLATNSYRVAGGAGFAGAHPSRLIYEGTDGNRDVLEMFLRAGGEPTQIAEPPWRFLPIPGATATFDTAASALAHLSEVPHLRLEPVGPLQTGFHRFRLHL